MAVKLPGNETIELLAPGVGVRLVGDVNIDAAWEPSGVTDQFLAEADTYHERYFDNAHWSWLVGCALKGLITDQSAKLRILDIGSGSGNTIYPLSQEFPNSSIVASDISPQLLAILMRNASERPEIYRRLDAYCFDLHNDFFVPDSFDGVLGGAILHHMLDPIAALRNVAKWVKPGGWIALVEPLERGWLMAAIVYHTLLEEMEDDGPPELIGHFKAMILDIEARLGAPRQKPITPLIDDKWFFSPTFVREMANALGFSRWSLEPCGELHSFQNTCLGTLAASGWVGVPPQKMLDVLAEFDNQVINGSVRQRFQPDGVIRFWR
jgi:SAM-dependent methyltransferase